MGFANKKQFPSLLQLTSLQVLHMNVDDGELLQLCERLTSLKCLNLSSSQHLSDRGIQKLSLLTNLRELIIYGANLTDNCWKIFGGLPKLENLMVTGGIINPRVAAWQKFAQHCKKPSTLIKGPFPGVLHINLRNDS